MVVRYSGLHGDIRSAELTSLGHSSNSTQADRARILLPHVGEDVLLSPHNATFSASIVWDDVGREQLDDDDRAAEEDECRQSLGTSRLERPSMLNFACVDCWGRMSHGYRCSCDGMPCPGCAMRPQRGQQRLLGCDGSRSAGLMMMDILPPSHTVMHQKQSIEDCVRKHVQAWDYKHPVEVFLTSGFGHPLPWALHEFRPTTGEFLLQYQYTPEVGTGLTVRCEKWSPPLGIIRLHHDDVWKLERYLDELMTSEHLLDFASICFEEESQVDNFQATMLVMICKLYLADIDRDLQQLLHKLIRMIIITYIMGHTLTITAETLPTIHKHLKHHGKPAQPASRTSPRLANRQLKFFLHVLREESYQEVLRLQQETLQTGGDKDSTWLPAFCTMLALAMKLECSLTDAQMEARNACERIDARYAQLIRLFQHKYRDEKWVSGGSFGPRTPLLRDAVEHAFCRNVKGLLVRSESHLRCRKDVAVSPNNQCQYTSRLVGRFLMPFLSL